MYLNYSWRNKWRSTESVKLQLFLLEVKIIKQGIVFSGAPQGSMLGPNLFIFFTTNLSR